MFRRQTSRCKKYPNIHENQNIGINQSSLMDKKIIIKYFIHTIIKI